MNKEQDTVIQGWVARDGGNKSYERELHLFTNKPERRILMRDWFGRPSMSLDSKLFPDLTWKSEPIECEIIIKRKKEEMKDKLKAIWVILFAQKMAVFTWKEEALDELGNLPAVFRYVLSHNWRVIGLNCIKQTVEKILNGESK